MQRTLLGTSRALSLDLLLSAVAQAHLSGALGVALPSGRTIRLVVREGALVGAWGAEGAFTDDWRARAVQAVQALMGASEAAYEWEAMEASEVRTLGRTLMPLMGALLEAARLIDEAA